MTSQPRTPTQEPSPRRRTLGYTAVELMLSLAVLAVGSAGIITMQRVTAQANRHARALATATHIAQAWLDELVAESSVWQQAGNFNNTDWLSQQSTVGWFRPAYVISRSWGSAFDYSGRAMSTANDRTAFCTDLRFTWLYPEVGVASQGSGLLRAEVRVYWQRSAPTGLTQPLGNNPCTWTPLEISGPQALNAYHFVHMSTAILQQDTGLPPTP